MHLESLQKMIDFIKNFEKSLSMMACHMADMYERIERLEAQVYSNELDQKLLSEMF